MFRQQKRSEIVEPVFDAARRSGIGLDVVVVANGVNGRRSERKRWIECIKINKRARF